jgi:predicted metal-dependent hydrolase
MSAFLDAYRFPDYVNIKHSSRARRVALRMDTKARRFDLIVPEWMDLSAAQDFALSQQNWMQEKLAELPHGAPFEDGAEIPVLGKLRVIRIEKHDKKITKLDLREGELFVQTHLREPSPRIQRFLKELALEVMSKLVHEKAALIGKTVREVQVRDTKSRWGSCSSDRRVMLSWRLILAPYEAMDYVIAHEIAHLKHMDHSKKFWALCSELSDDYMEGKYWMRHHAQELMAFGAD